MTEPVPAVPIENVLQRPASPVLDWIAGASLGALLAVLVGMTITPVVSTVVTALVALLAGLFSLSEKISPAVPQTAIRRLAAFSLAAAIVLPGALLMRSHNLLGRSVESQVRELDAMQITDPKDRAEILKFLRFGLMPKGYAVTESAAKTAGPVTPAVLYSVNQDLCGELRSLDAEAALADRLLAFESGGVEGQRMAAVVRKRPEAEQLAAAKAIQDYGCYVEAGK